MKIFELRADVEHFRRLMFEEKRDNGLLFKFEGQSLAAEWIPPQVRFIREDVENGLPDGDFMDLGTIPVFRAGTLPQSMRRILEGDGELLPLSSAEGEFLAYNVTSVIDALIEDQSQLARFPDGRIMRVEQGAFNTRLLRNAMIFKIPQKRRPEVFVTEQFVREATQAEMTGFRFVPHWPLPDEPGAIESQIGGS